MFKTTRAVKVHIYNISNLDIDNTIKLYKIVKNLFNITHVEE